MTGFARILHILPAALAALSFMLSGCEKIEGAPYVDGKYPDGGLISGVPCLFDGDCGDGRYCSDAKICAIDCRASPDCSLFPGYPRFPDGMYCSECGRCLATGVKDLLCEEGMKDIPCAASETCTERYGKNFLCSADGYCTMWCKTDNDCHKVMGTRFSCTDVGDGTRTCTKLNQCTWDNHCYMFGWGYRCDLPAGTDQFLNTYPAPGDKSLVSNCVKDPSGIDWGGYTDPAIPSYDYRGVWGMLLNTAARSTGMPLFAYMNTVDIQYMLVKVTQNSAGGVNFNIKWCSIELVNFLEKDEPFDATQIIIPNRYTEFVPVQVIGSRAAVPPMTAGARFLTQRLFELRGADLADPERDPLPDYRSCPGGDCPEQWDQDKDGKPGMTTFITGIVGTGEIYIAKKWTLVLDAAVLDSSHMQGLVTHTFEQSVIGSNPPDFNYTLAYESRDPDRSYFRALRMPDSASCEDVMAESKKKGSFLEFQWHCPECL
ncbi:MAG: hypothetical protein WC889_17505 [Myxococcota bacterium]